MFSLGLLLFSFYQYIVNEMPYKSLFRRFGKEVNKGACKRMVKSAIDEAFEMLQLQTSKTCEIMRNLPDYHEQSLCGINPKENVRWKFSLEHFVEKSPFFPFVYRKGLLLWTSLVVFTVFGLKKTLRVYCTFGSWLYFFCSIVASFLFFVNFSFYQLLLKMTLLAWVWQVCPFFFSFLTFFFHLPLPLVFVSNRRGWRLFCRVNCCSSNKELCCSTLI